MAGTPGGRNALLLCIKTWKNQFAQDDGISLDVAEAQMSSKYALLALALAASETLAGGIYKWVDEQGRTVYSDTPPPGKTAKEVDLPPQPPKEQLDAAQEALERQRAAWAPQLVLGTLALSFAPTALASLPQPPMGLTLSVKPTMGSGEFKFRVDDPSPQWTVGAEGKSATFYQNFKLSLKPGTYKLDRIEVDAPSLSSTPFHLLFAPPGFTVPEGNCVYIGRLGMAYMRLPRGSLAQAKEAIKPLAKEAGKPVVFHYLVEGTLVPVADSVDTPSGAELQQGKGGSQAYADARAKNCVVRLATH